MFLLRKYIFVVKKNGFEGGKRILPYFNGHQLKTFTESLNLHFLL
jgi:hypothetical protein